MRISAVGNPDIGRWTQEFGEANYKGSNHAFVVVDTVSLQRRESEYKRRGMEVYRKNRKESYLPSATPIF